MYMILATIAFILCRSICSADPSIFGTSIKNDALWMVSVDPTSGDFTYLEEVPNGLSRNTTEGLSALDRVRNIIYYVPDPSAPIILSLNISSSTALPSIKLGSAIQIRSRVHYDEQHEEVLVLADYADSNQDTMLLVASIDGSSVYPIFNFSMFNVQKYLGSGVDQETRFPSFYAAYLTPGGSVMLSKVEIKTPHSYKEWELDCQGYLMGEVFADDNTNTMIAIGRKDDASSTKPKIGLIRIDPVASMCTVFKFGALDDERVIKVSSATHDPIANAMYFQMEFTDGTFQLAIFDMVKNELSWTQMTAHVYDLVSAYPV